MPGMRRRDVVALLGGAAGYIDRILRGDKPSELPVQAPTSSRRSLIS
jgi:hypothetical protein